MGIGKCFNASEDGPCKGRSQGNLTSAAMPKLCGTEL